MVRNKYALLAFRLIVGGFFIWAGALKVVHPMGFAEDIMAYGVFPRAFAFFAALTLPWIELVCGVVLVVGLFRRASAFVISGLLLAFIVLVIITMARGADLVCGCLGALSGKVGWPLLIQDMVLLHLALNIVASPRASFALDAVRETSTVK